MNKTEILILGLMGKCKPKTKLSSRQLIGEASLRSLRHAYGHKDGVSPYLASIFAFELISLVCGIAPNLTALIAGRAVAGLGAAGIGTAVYTIIAFLGEPKKRPMFTGIIGISYGIASVLGPLLVAPSLTGCHGVGISMLIYQLVPYPGLIILLSFFAPGSAKPSLQLGKRNYGRWT